MGIRHSHKIRIGNVAVKLADSDIMTGNGHGTFISKERNLQG